MRLKDKVIIITGSTMGIGKAIAKKAVSEGAKIIIHGLEKDLGLELQNDLGKQNAVLHIEDLSNEGCSNRLVSLAIKTWNKLDGVVNNAALVISSNIEDTDKKLLQNVININTLAPFFLIKSALTHLAKTNGAVLNIEPPTFVEKKVVSTEPGLKGDTVSNTLKPAKLSSGIEVQVPLFVNEDDTVKIDTRDGSYVGRVKE